MDADRTQIVKDVFGAAAELPAEERPGYLDGVCKDPAMREQVEKLLAALEDAGEFLAEPTIITPAAADRRGIHSLFGGHGVVTGPLRRPEEEGPGSRIGRYKLLQEIGEGGFGVVYMAEQEEPVRRRVALKIIKLGMDTKQVIGRFEAERQALAMMEHPNIARVLDAGSTAGGRPYFVMELVRGLPITEYCDRHNLTTRERLELFFDVCRAVQHAHQKGIIHRDIKPSNVMVTLHDGKPVPKVIDFGIAKATNQRLTERTVFTEYQQFIGTPAYMSPEQAEMSGLEVDTRTDIYALGVLLYELLTGTTPIDAARLRSAGFAEIQRIIREEEPPRPSTRLSTLGETLSGIARKRRAEATQLARLLRGELDWIVMKAIDKDRTRRYESAGSFGEDVRRYLSDETVMASPPSRTYRLGKFVRRHRVAVATAASIAAALLVGAGMATYGFVEARREAARAEAEASKAGAINQFLERMLIAANPAGKGGPTVTVREVLDSAAAEIEKGDLREQPLVEAAVRQIIGATYRQLGLLEEAQGQLDAALKARLASLPADDVEVARSLDSLASLAEERGDYPTAEKHFREALAILDRTADPPLRLEANINNNLGLLLHRQGRTDEAEALLERGLELDRQTLPADSVDLASTLNNLALIKRARGDKAGAEKLFRDALKVLNGAYDGEHIHIAAVLESIGALRSDEADYEEAERLMRQALEMRRKLLGEDHPYVAHSLNGLGLLFSRTGDFDRAEPMLREALDKRRAIYGDDHPNVANSLNNLGLMLIKRGDYAEAEQVLQEALAIRREKLGEEHLSTLNTMHNLAATWRHQGRLEEATELIDRVVKTADTSLPEGSWFRHLFRGERGSCLLATKRFDEAEVELIASYRGLKAEFGAEHPETRTAFEQVVATYEAAGRPAEAQAWRSAGGEPGKEVGPR